MDSSKRLPSLSRGSNSLYSKTQSDGDVHSPHPDCSIPFFSEIFHDHRDCSNRNPKKFTDQGLLELPVLLRNDPPTVSFDLRLMANGT